LAAWRALRFGHGEKVFSQRKMSNGKIGVDGKRLVFRGFFSAFFWMGLPKQPITLTVGQLEELHGKLAQLRHDINNNLSLMIAAVELIKHKPQMSERMLATLGEQPSRVSASLNKFSAEFERALGITRP